MALEWQLVNGKQVLFRIPIRIPAEGSEPAPELGEEEVERLVDLFSVAANERRFRMMQELHRRGEMMFSDLLEVAENPKLVTDCMRPLVEEGLVEHEKWGSAYRPTRAGFVVTATMTGLLPRLLEFLEEEEDLERV